MISREKDSPGTRGSLRVLLLAHNVKGSGTYIRFRGFARELARRAHRVTLIAASESWSLPLRRTESDGVKLIVTPAWFSRRLRNGGLSPEDVSFRMWHVKKPNYDLVHASEHRPAGSLPAKLARALHGTAYISDWADLWGRGGIASERSWLMQRLLTVPETSFEQRAHRSADGVTAVCSGLYGRARKLGVPESRLLHLPNGVDIELIRPLNDKESIRGDLGLPHESKLLVYAGYAPIDMDLIWESFRFVYERRRDTFLVVLGRVWPGTERLGPANDHVIQMGYLPRAQYAQALASGDVMLLPYRDTSRNRGRWPGKMSFYMATGLPTVSNPTGDIRTLFEEEGVGILAGEHPQEFAEAILRLLEDEQLADQIGRRARVIAEKKFAWPVLAASLEEFYYSALAQGRA